MWLHSNILFFLGQITHQCFTLISCDQLLTENLSKAQHLALEPVIRSYPLHSALPVFSRMS